MLLTALTVAALKPIYLAFDSNFTTSGSDFDWRLTGIVSASASRLAGAQVFWSTTGQFSPNHISNDVFYGVNYYTLGAPPSGYLAFYDWAADVNVSDREWLSLDVSAAAGFVGHTVWLIEERTPNNTAARRYPLALALWKSDPVPWSPQADGVNATTFTGSGPGGSSIRITYLVASRRGTLNVQNSTSAIVVPKGIEFLVEVEGWPYASPDNHLAVHIGIGTANVQAQASGSIVTRLVHARNASIRPNDTEVYVAFVQNCVADGSLRPVGVEVLVNGSSDVVAWNSYLTTQLKFAYGGDASLADVVVSFPPNASYILYDPGAGAGTPPPVPEELNGNGDGSGKTAVILTITLVIVVAVIAAGVAWVMVHRRRDRYNAV